MISKQPTIDDIYNFDAYISTPGVREGLMQRAAAGDEEFSLEDTDAGQAMYFNTAHGEQVFVGMPEKTMPGRQPGDVMLAAGPSGTTSDAGLGVSEMKPIPRNAVVGGVANFVRDVRDMANQMEFRDWVPLLAGMGVGDFLLNKSPEEIENWAYGNSPITMPPSGTGGYVPIVKTGRKDGLADVLGLGIDVVPIGKGLGTAAKVGLKAGTKLLPEVGQAVAKSMDALGTPLQMGVVPLEKWSSVTANTAAKVDAGKVKLSDKVTKGQELQLAPEYRVKVTGAYTPDGKTQNIINAVNPGNYDETVARLDVLTQSFPDPLESPEKFSAMLAAVYNSNEVPIPPRWMIEHANDMPKWSSWFGQMTKGQLDEADRGFAVVDKFKQIYSDGTASPETTGRLMMWAMLSRRASAYPHESGFLDLAEAMTPLIQKALRGEYGQADIDAGLQMIKQTIPTGSPGKSVTSNANDFVKTFLTKMSERTPDNRTKLQALHDMIADPNMTGPEIRRSFFGLAQDVGIKNKVLSFALLVSGREDVMVLDRIQINRLFAGGEKIYDNVAHLFDGGPGLAIYEGLERSLGARINELYANVGRPDKASLGRYHWESWVLSSGQEVAHPTLDTIVKAAKGDANPFANVPVMEGRTHKTSYGVTYERMPDGSNQFVFPAEDGTKYAMTKPSLDALFDRVMKGKEKLVPKDFPGVNFFEKDTLPDGNPNPYFGKPWYSWPGVNRERIDELAATFGTKINTPSGTGSLESTGASQAAGGSVGTKRAPARKRASLIRGDAAPTSGAQ